jgi:hypothetical protein
MWIAGQTVAGRPERLPYSNREMVSADTGKQFGNLFVRENTLQLLLTPNGISAGIRHI